MKTKTIILLIISLTLIITCFALPVLAGTYPATGGEDGTHSVDGLGYFNSINALNIEVTGVRTISSPSFHPLVDDLDGDGENEIIIFNGNTMEMYSELTLGVIDAVSMTGVGPTNIRATVYDIDGDGYKEVIARAYNDATVDILEYNGTHIFIEHTFEMLSSISDCIFECVAANRCVAACTYRMTPASGLPVQMRYDTFNSTQVIRSTTGTSITYGTNACPLHPSVPSFYIGNTDTDSDLEVVTSYVIYVHSVPDSVNRVVEIYNLYDNNSMSYQARDTSADAGMGVYAGANTDACYLTGADKYITSPGVGNLDGAVGDGLEIVVGMMDSTDTYEINQYSGINLHLDETYNDGVFSGEGELVSNVMFMDAFPRSSTQDFCVVAFEKTEQEITALCGTNSPAFGYLDEQSFDMPLSSFMNWNVSQSVFSYTRLTTATDMISTLEDGENLDEIVTSFGILSLDYDSVSGEDLQVVYNSPIGRDAILLPVDVQGNGLNDLLAMTTSNLYYVDDGFSNTPAFINEDYSEIDPCTSRIWKLNTSVLISVRADDIDTGDRVQARAILYYGTANENDTGWSAPTTSPTDYSFVFEANKSIVGGVAYVMVRDPDENNRSFPDDLCSDPTTDVGCKKFIFSVSPTGTEEFGGGCVESFGTDPDDVGEEEDDDIVQEGGACDKDSDCAGYPDSFCNNDGACQALIDISDNKLTDGLKEASVLSGMPLLLLLVIVIGTILYYVYQSNIGMAAKGVMTFLVPLIVFGMGAALNLISSIWVILTIVIIIFGAALAFGLLGRGG